MIDAELQRLPDMFIHGGFTLIRVGQHFIEVVQLAGFKDKIGDGQRKPERVVAAVLFDGGRFLEAGAGGSAA